MRVEPFGFLDPTTDTVISPTVALQRLSARDKSGARSFSAFEICHGQRAFGADGDE
jgi:hypothetical protein